jgi:hypothetical protein
MMLHRFACKYSTRDIVEEYHSIPVCPLVDGWAVPRLDESVRLHLRL